MEMINKNLDLTEFNKLVEICKENNWQYEIQDMFPELCNGKICILYKDNERICDAVIHLGSYGNERGLLEFADVELKDVTGYLNAEGCAANFYATLKKYEDPRHQLHQVCENLKKDFVNTFLRKNGEKAK